MKKLIFLWLLSLLAIPSFCQKIFPDTFAIWQEYEQNLEDPNEQYIAENSYLMQGDTLLNGKNYKIVYQVGATLKVFKNGQVNGPFTVNNIIKFGMGKRVGGVRKEGKKLFYISFGGQEILTYDYAVQTGDTSISTFGGRAKLNKDSMVYGHRYFEVQYLSPANYPGAKYIVEGMGSNHTVLPINGVFYINTYVVFFCGDGISFAGIPLGVGGWSDTEIAGNCNKNLSALLSVEENTQSSTISVYPNPVIDNLVITNLSEQSVITITDITGKTIKQLTAANNSETISLAGLQMGVYMLVIANGQSTSVQKIIKQ